MDFMEQAMPQVAAGATEDVAALRDACAPPAARPTLRGALARWADDALDPALYEPARPVPGEPPEHFRPDARLDDGPRGPLPPRPVHWMLAGAGHRLKARLVGWMAKRVRQAAAWRAGHAEPLARPTAQDLLDLMNLGREQPPRTAGQRLALQMRLAARLLALDAACRRQRRLRADRQAGVSVRATAGASAGAAALPQTRGAA